MTLQLQQKNAEGQEVRRPNLTGIPTQMKLDFERRSGLSFDDVRVHYNSDKPAQLKALAYTQGTQVYIGPGQEQHLPHELGHVIQQKSQTITPDTVQNGVPINSSQALEQLADHYAAGWRVNRSQPDEPVYNQIPVVQRCPFEEEEGPEEEEEPDWGMGSSDWGDEQPIWGDEPPVWAEEPPVWPVELPVWVEDEEGNASNGLDRNSLEDFYSDDESSDNGDVYSYETKSGRSETGKHGSNKSEHQVDGGNQKSDDQLTSDAVEIHNALPEGQARNGCTVVCARFVTNKGKYIHYAMVNDATISPALREAARSKGYLLLCGIKTHAEANMILYALKHRRDLILEAFGCDKPSCPQCVALIQAANLNHLRYTERAPKVFSKKYYFQRRWAQSLRGPNERMLFRRIQENYNDDGTKK